MHYIIVSPKNAKAAHRLINGPARNEYVYSLEKHLNWIGIDYKRLKKREWKWYKCVKTYRGKFKQEYFDKLDKNFIPFCEKFAEFNDGWKNPADLYKAYLSNLPQKKKKKIIPIRR